MIIFFKIIILCTSNYDEEINEQKNNVENAIPSNLDINQNPSLTHFNQTLENTTIRNHKFSIEMIFKTNDHCLKNVDSYGKSSNLRNNEEKIYVSNLHFKTKINADDHILSKYSASNNIQSVICEEKQSNVYNFYKDAKQTSHNENISSNNHLILEGQNDYNNTNQDTYNNNFIQLFSKNKNDEKHYDISKYSRINEILQDQLLDYSTKNKGVSKNQINGEFHEINKLLETDKKLIKKDNEKSSQNIIPSKKVRTVSYPFDIDSILTDPYIPTNDDIQRETKAFKIKSNIPKPIANIKTDYNRTISNIKKVVININENDKIKNSENKVNEKSQLNPIPSSSKTTEKTNNFSDILNTSETFLPSKNNKPNLTSDNEFNSPYGIDFESPKFSLDILNSYIDELNANYLRKCKNIFSVVVNKIIEVANNTESPNKVSNLAKYRSNLKLIYYTKINFILKIILKEILGDEIPVSIFTNYFINLYDGNLDMAKSKHDEYNIFRTNEQENGVFNSLIDNTEQKYKFESNKMAKSAYNDFIKKINPDFLILMDEIISGQIKNRNILNSNMNYIFININKFINFTNDQITETESLIIYKVLKSISKNLKKASNDLFISCVFPEFRIINILYHSRMNDHHLSGRKFHVGIFLKKILKQKLKDFKEKYQSFEKIDNLDDDYLKGILEIRTVYIFNFFKFINIKKPYLMAYILLSIKSYLLQSQKIDYTEKNDFEKIFSLHVLNLDDIFYQQVILDFKIFIK
ncbi:hypothetical protein DMUE_1529 [Dictyocoela muelleri]|nr:hypothetical protein DMUE_1529 [Dictyocoela muelleri]